MSALAHTAAEGFRDAAAYDAHRPAYPAEAVQRLLEHMRLADRAHARIVEVAAGTGKFTEALAARHEGFEVAAVEPHPEMRAALEAKGLRGVSVGDGTAEDMRGVEDGWGDGCVAAQAFHWFATDKALDEIHRVMERGAVFGMIWNIDDYNKPKSWTASTSWAQHLNEWIHSLASEDAHPFRELQWQEVFSKQLKSNPMQVIRDTLMNNLPQFSLPIGQDSVEWTHWLTEGALWKRINTLSQVAMLQGEERVKAEGVFREAMAMADVVRNEKGENSIENLERVLLQEQVDLA
ncbi:hypothetical protein VSDG_06437 [Cytospora chrysosperma]|uniref:Methyltransferase type 11 domain-containing protein n=1 Tax=Cytospora chrysosperma TaxID=252740 RepID=A0A423VL91_CYTCH|nr:hypothetical protein VSDG_06437 [Valsa sordida]